MYGGHSYADAPYAGLAATGPVNSTQTPSQLGVLTAIHPSVPAVTALPATLSSASAVLAPTVAIDSTVTPSVVTSASAVLAPSVVISSTVSHQRCRLRLPFRLRLLRS